VLLSMTGFGEAHHQQDDLAVTVEVRTINNRFFKLSVRSGEGYTVLEPQIEAVVRKAIRRGTVQVNLCIDRAKSPEDFNINAGVLQRYRTQLESLHPQPNQSGSVSLESLLALPGVVEENAAANLDAAEDWPVIGATLEAAMDNLSRMRIEEGRTMADDLAANCRAIAASLKRVRQRAPLVADAYRSRLEERVGKMLAEHEIVLEPKDVIKEVALFAERADISEEVVRLQSHLDQFDTIMGLPESSGRKLEFLTQEMFRETNTIGSKANDVEIAQDVIDIKTAIERIREMIQNIE